MKKMVNGIVSKSNQKPLANVSIFFSIALLIGIVEMIFWLAFAFLSKHLLRPVICCDDGFIYICAS